MERIISGNRPNARHSRSSCRVIARNTVFSTHERRRSRGVHPAATVLRTHYHSPWRRGYGKSPRSVRVRLCQRRHTLPAGCPIMRQASRFESGCTTSAASVCEGRSGWGHAASLPVRQAHRWSPVAGVPRRMGEVGARGVSSRHHQKQGRRARADEPARGQWPYTTQHGGGHSG